MDALSSPRSGKLACIGGAIGAACIAAQLASKGRHCEVERGADAAGADEKRARATALSDDTASEAPAAGPAEFFRISTQDELEELSQLDAATVLPSAAGPALFYRMSTDDSLPVLSGLHSRSDSGSQLASYLESTANEKEECSSPRSSTCVADHRWASEPAPAIEQPGQECSSPRPSTCVVDQRRAGEPALAVEQPGQDVSRHRDLERRPVANARPSAGSVLAWSFGGWQARLVGPWAWQGALACAIAGVTILQASAGIRPKPLA